MLTFPENFFKDEVRNNFLISEMMKRAWAAHLKILDELQTLFKKYDLLYYADFGTLLGAVRHGGIIPWDDDIDISMPRSDFMKLLEHADEIGGGLTIRSVYNTDSFYNFHAVATNKTDILKWDEKRMSEYYGCPFICYIDIFPMDYIPRDPDRKKLMQQLYSYAYQMVHTCVEIEDAFCGGRLITYKELKNGLDKYCKDIVSSEVSSKVNGYLSQLKELEGFLERFYDNKITIAIDKCLRNQLCRVTEYIASSSNYKDADRVDYCPHMAYLKRDLSRDKNWVKETQDMPFEVTRIAVPKKYHEVLVSRFGTGYMTPRNLPSTHDYPYYRTQVEVLIEGDTGENYHEYPQKKELLSVLDTFKEGHQVLGDLLEQELKEDSERGDTKDTVTKEDFEDDSARISSIKGLLADLQDGAVGIGEAIDNICGEGTDIVKELERYCESLYGIYENVEAHHDVNSLSNILSKVRSSIVKQIHEPVPADWEQKLLKADGTSKKVVIYALSAIEVLTSGSKSADKIRDSFTVFEDAKDDVCVIFEVPAGFETFLDRCGLELGSSYKDVISFVREKKNCIFDDGRKLELAVSLADAYYGDECPLMNICKSYELPVMIQNYDIRQNCE
ncbi:LicD family protein [Butyrivibrio fibrisolvens]|uniref:LicD family protein n=1 Tax=Butyrivibrio fibrisolvens TaxID=831 RepID=UPI0003B52AE1|nr:LicD family protein [Butyrivibrio fibrisolvens]